MTTQLERTKTQLDELPMLIDGELIPSESGAGWNRRIRRTKNTSAACRWAVQRTSTAPSQRRKRRSPGGRLFSGDARGAYLNKLADAMAARAEEILRVEVLDTGNTISKMRADVHHASMRCATMRGSPTKFAARAFRPPRITCTSPCASRTASSAASSRSTIRSCSRIANGGAADRRNTIVEKPSDQSRFPPLFSPRSRSRFCRACREHHYGHGRRGRRCGRAPSARETYRVHRLGRNGHAHPAIGGGSRGEEHLARTGWKNPMIVFPMQTRKRSTPRSTA